MAIGQITGNSVQILQAAALFTAHTRRKSILMALTGKFPKEADAAGLLRRQTSPNMPIVVNNDLTSQQGGLVRTEFVQPITGYPIMGSEMAAGTGSAQEFSTLDFLIDQSRKVIDAGSVMNQQKSANNLLNLANAHAMGYFAVLEDQARLVHLAGARGWHNNGEWLLPTNDHARFSKIMINPVKAPSRNRHFVVNANSTGITDFVGGYAALTSASSMSLSVLDAIRATLSEMAYAPAKIVFPDDPQSTDNPLRVLLVSPSVMRDLQQSNDQRIRTYQSYAMSRGNKMSDNILFTGGSILFSNILVVEMERFVRFLRLSELKYCADYATEVETAWTVDGTSVPAGYALDRCILLGAQSLAVAYGGSKTNGQTFFLKEQKTDFDDKTEVAVGMINGMSKVRFNINMGGTVGEQITDLGATIIDCVTKIA